MLKINLNDEWVEIDETRLSDAMTTWNYHSKKCAVAVNGEFVPRADHQQTLLKDGDAVDVVAPVGGG